jgi:hypothetical protein
MISKHCVVLFNFFSIICVQNTHKRSFTAFGSQPRFKSIIPRIRSRKVWNDTATLNGRGGGAFRTATHGDASHTRRNECTRCLCWVRLPTEYSHT